MMLPGYSEKPSSGGRERGIFDQFVARMGLLAGIYLIINVVYQQSYLGVLGMSVGLWPIASTLPLISDYLVAIYAFIIWIVLSRMPDIWFNNIAEMGNLGTWRDRYAFRYRILGVTFSLSVLHVLHLLFYRIVEPQTRSFWRVYWLSTEFLSWDISFYILIPVSVIVILVSLVYYNHLRRKGIGQLERSIRRGMLFILNFSVIVSIILGLITSLLVIPSWYGKIRAVNDINRMVFERFQEVRKIELINPACDLPMKKVDDYYIFETTNRNIKISYLGRFMEMHLFALSKKIQRSGLPNMISFSPCLISDKNLSAVELFDKTTPNLATTP